MTEDSLDSSAVVNLPERYSELDGGIVYVYPTHFAEVAQALSSVQQAQLGAIVDAQGHIHPAGAFLYSQPIATPKIPNTDLLFS
jgi:hypothetical protein